MTRLLTLLQCTFLISFGTPAFADEYLSFAWSLDMYSYSEPMIYPYVSPTAEPMIYPYVSPTAEPIMDSYVYESPVPEPVIAIVALEPTPSPDMCTDTICSTCGTATDEENGAALDAVMASWDLQMEVEAAALEESPEL